MKSMGDSTVFGAMEDWFHSPSPAALSLLNKFLSEDGGSLDSFLLKKASILCSIQHRIAGGSVPEGILDSLLLIEQLDRGQGLPVSDSMRAAFSAVAIHCTLSSLPHSWPSYYDSVLRIWGSRLRHLEDSGTTHLLGPDLAKWRHDVEAALWHSESSQKLMRLNTRGDALLRLLDYLREATSSIKPDFLRLAFPASQDPAAAAPPAPTSPPDKGRRILRVNPTKKYKLDAGRHSRGPVVIADVEEERPSCSNYGSLSSAKVNKVQDALKSSMADLLDVVTDPLPEALKVAERVASILEERNRDKDGCAISVNPAAATSGNPNMEPAQATERNLHTRAIDEPQSERDKSISSTPSIPPTSKCARPKEGDQDLHTRAIDEHQSERDKSISSTPSIPPTSKCARPKEGDQEKQGFVHQNKVPRPSLMERNGTARTYEWEDSIDVSGTSSSSQRCRLPSPKVKHVSPLKDGELRKWKRTRKRTMWSALEEQALADGVIKHGTHWNLILKSNPEAFVNRNAVDLKDKWRNMHGR